MNKEKLLFAFALIVSILVLKHHMSMAFSPLPPQKGFEKKFPREVLPMEQDFSQKFSERWKNSRELFEKLRDKKKLPAVYLEQPELKLPKNIVLPPIPAPMPKYWSEFSSSRFSPLGPEFADSVDEKKISKALVNAEQIQLSSLAKQLNSKVRVHDIVQLKKNKQKFVGSIIEQNANKVMINISGKKTYTWKRDQVTIKRAITLRELCSKRFQKISTSPKQLLELAQACGELGLNTLASEYFENLLTLAPEFADGYLAYAYYYQKQLNFENACRIYFRAMGNGVDTRETRMALANLQAKLGLKQQALKTLKPCDGVLCLSKSLEMAYSLQNWSLAKRLTEKLENIAPESEYGDIACYWKARWAFLHGKIDRCIEYCEQAINPTTDIYNLQGAALYLQGKLEQAAVLLQIAAKSDARAWYNLALVYFAGGAPDPAIKILEFTRRKAPVVLNPSRTLATLAYFIYVSDSFALKRAIDIIELAQQSNRENFLVYYLYGEILGKTPAKALEKYSKALDLEYSCNDPLLKSAILAWKTKRIEDAFYFAQELSQRREFLTSQDKGYLYELLARIYLERGRKIVQCALGGSAFLRREKALQAQKNLENAADIAPDNKSALCMLAWLHNNLGNTSEAISYLNQVVEKNEHFRYALDAREKIIENGKRVYWEDLFNRPGGDAVRLGWLENEPQGTEIFLEKNEVVMIGKGLVKSPTTLSRKVKSEKLVNFDAKLNFSFSANAHTGIFIMGYPNGLALYLGKGGKSELQYSFKGQKEWKAVLYENTPSLLRDVHTLGIYKEKRNSYRLYLDKRLLEPKISLNLENYPQLEIGIYGFCEQDSEWKLSIEEARIVEKK